VRGERYTVFKTRFQRRGVLIKEVCKRLQADGWHSATFSGFDASQVFSEVLKGEAPETSCLIERDKGLRT
jgi:hypothetical protein